MNKSVDPYKRDLNYYETIDKVFWVPVNDVILPDGEVIKADNPTPCIYAEEKDGKYNILQFDMSIEFDKWRYTAWRKVLGISYGIRVEVFLIYKNKLYTLEGKEIDFNSFGRSDIWIDKKFLGRCDVKDT